MMQNIKGKAVQRAGLIAFTLTALVAITLFATGTGASIDNVMREQRYNFTDDVEASGTVGMISIDDRSLRDLGSFPWTRSTHADLINSLQGAGVAGLAFDIAFFTDAPAKIDDENLANAIRNSDFPVALAVPTIDDGNIDIENMEGNYPLEKFSSAGAENVSIWMTMNEDGAVDHMNSVNMLDDKPMPTISGWLAKATTSERVRIDWSLDDDKINNFSYSDILTNGPTEEMRGMRLIVGADSSMLGDAYAVPSGNLMAGARIHAMAAETHIKGANPVIPEQTVMLIVMALLMGLSFLANAPTRYIACAASLIALPTIQWQLEGRDIAEITIGSSMLTIMFLIVASTSLHVLRYFYGKITQNEGTGIPNLIAMKVAAHDPGMTIALSVRNHIDILSELGGEGRDKIMAKLARCIEMGSNGRIIYQVDSSTFAWRGGNDLDIELGNIETLLTLLRPGISYGNGNIDIHVTIGIEQNSSLGAEQSVTNATIACNRAADRGIAWEVYESGDNAEHWKISVVSEITTAIANEDLWVAYQPKVDSVTGKVMGAEALVRWKHPTRGDVRPDAFIPLLEKANRTDELTRYMLNKAIRDFTTIPDCSIAVNVSPLMVGKGKLLGMVNRALEIHDFDPKRLTIEVTESERFTAESAVEELEAIHKLGVKISIDDYGMGNSTVNYLRILPADELKIDRSFISNVLANRSDKMVVASTINLAHEMGLKVVAEGVESAEIQAYLQELRCDFIQGYHTGKPVNFDEFKAVLEHSSGTRRKVASVK